MLTRFSRALLLVALLIGAAPAFAQNGPSNCNGTLANCTPTFSQNGIQSFTSTYKYSSLGNTPAAAPTDIFTITGSATKVVRVTKIVISGAATTAGDLNPLIIRRSAADTGGTSTAPALLARDTLNTAATAVLALYTVSPTGLGTVVGTVDSCRLFLQVVTAGPPDVCGFTYGINDDQLMTLRGPTDILAVNFAGATLPSGATVDIDVELTESPQ
jgi:hypothetical protein